MLTWFLAENDSEGIIRNSWFSCDVIIFHNKLKF